MVPMRDATTCVCGPPRRRPYCLPPHGCSRRRRRRAAAAPFMGQRRPFLPGGSHLRAGTQTPDCPAFRRLPRLSPPFHRRSSWCCCRCRTGSTSAISPPHRLVRPSQSTGAGGTLTTSPAGCLHRRTAFACSLRLCCHSAKDWCLACTAHHPARPRPADPRRGSCLPRRRSADLTAAPQLPGWPLRQHRLQRGPGETGLRQPGGLRGGLPVRKSRGKSRSSSRSSNRSMGMGSSRSIEQEEHGHGQQQEHRGVGRGVG